VIGDGRPCGTGTPEMAARNKDALFPGEGGPAILEVGVPAWIMAILWSDPIAAGLGWHAAARSGLSLRAGSVRCGPNGTISLNG
jgi:hypothetical protein